MVLECLSSRHRNRQEKRENWPNITRRGGSARQFRTEKKEKQTPRGENTKLQKKKTVTNLCNAYSWRRRKKAGSSGGAERGGDKVRLFSFRGGRMKIEIFQEKRLPEAMNLHRLKGNSIRERTIFPRKAGGPPSSKKLRSWKTPLCFFFSMRGCIGD